MIILKCICLLLAIVYGFSNIVKSFRGHSVSDFQMWAMAIGIVGFIYLQFWR